MNFKKTALGVGFMMLATHAIAANTNNSANISSAEKAKIEQIVHDYLMNHPAVILQSVQKLQQKELESQYKAAKQSIKQTQQLVTNYTNPLFHQAGDPVAGNPKGKVTIVEFFDYQCQHCVEMAPVMDQIIKANPDLRVVYKDFPIRGPVSTFAAKAALAANIQGKYYDLSHALLISNKPLTDEVVIEIAKEKGLDIDKLKKDMNDVSVNHSLSSNTKLAKDLKLFGTPAFFIGLTDNNGKINYVPGQLNPKQLQNLIDAAAK